MEESLRQSEECTRSFHRVEVCGAGGLPGPVPPRSHHLPRSPHCDGRLHPGGSALSDAIRTRLRGRRKGSLMSAITGIMGPVQRESTRERVCTALRDAIYSGKLKLGQRLTELELTRELQVSRPVVREALQQLAHEGMIQLNSYRGAQVIDLTTEQIDE